MTKVPCFDECLKASTINSYEPMGRYSSEGLLREASKTWTDEQRIQFINTSIRNLTSANMVLGDSVRVARVAAMKGLHPYSKDATRPDSSHLRSLLASLTSQSYNNDGRPTFEHEMFLRTMAKVSPTNSLIATRGWYDL